jgi:Domain of unknown function (DUF5049)
VEAVRGSEQTNMLDFPKVQTIATRLGYFETVLWIDKHQREYGGSPEILMNHTVPRSAGSSDATG